MSIESQPSGVAGLAMTRSAKAQVVKNLVMSPEADEFLAELAQRSGLSEGNVLVLALGMFRTAIEAKQQGKHFGVAQNSENLDVELIGF